MQLHSSQIDRTLLYASKFSIVSKPNHTGWSETRWRLLTFEVEVELAVGPRRRVLSIEFADGDDVVMGQHGFAILVTG